MAKTYLATVNSVLTRLKEESVSSVSTDTDSSLIGEFVKEAVEWAERDHDWLALRNRITVSLATGEFSKSLTGAGERFKVLQVVNNTNDYRFGDAESWNDMRWYLQQNNQDSAPPYKWDIKDFDASGDPVINFWPKADQAYDIYVEVTIPHSLSDDADEIVIPTLPIEFYATALAREERGEEGGTTADRLFFRAETALAREINRESHVLWDEKVLEIV